ncbi:hypothetical protein SAMN04488078_104142 [Antarctobacter heliothermus]|uniref:Uncharacterized protein n=2 Tax=Antarctobacter heliothermus TaxID=74033 RepID=A0A239ICW5_9RHOB|nr:hypothetical protein SAMN04488078_104142 [Antarctobacter heliothermus]
MDTPPEALIKLVASDVHDGRLNQSVRDTIRNAITAAFKEIVRDRVRLRLNSALEDPSSDAHEAGADGKQEPKIADSGVVTTEEEVEGWLTIKAILREDIDTDRIFMRDAKSYCAVLLDDNNRKPIARMHFNGARKKFLGLFDGDTEERVELQSMKELFTHAERLKATLEKYQT